MYVMGIGAATVRTSTEGPEFILGTLGANAGTSTMYTAPMSDTGTTAGTNSGPKAYVYCSSAAGTTAGHVVLIDQANDVVSATATLGAIGTGYGKRVGVVVGTIAAGGYGWVQLYGAATCLVVAATAPNSQVSLSGTAGAFDDLTADGSISITGVNISAVNSTTGTVFLNWPHMTEDEAA